MRVKSGEQATFLEGGEVTFKEDGKKAEKFLVEEGEIIDFTSNGEIKGVEAVIFKRKLLRVLEKKRERAQKFRTCIEPMARLEVPDIVSTEARRIEMIHEQRGADLKRRLAMEGDRLRKA